MEYVRLNALDELFLHLDHREEPWVVHYEVRIAGRLDADRLAAAVAAAAARHPIARARLAGWHGSDLGYRWEIADVLDTPLTIVNCADEAELAAVRERLYSVSPSLAVAPPFIVVLAQTAVGDSLLLNLHHAAGDGIGAARLVLSILRAYAGVEDLLPPIDPLEVRDVYALAGAASPAERFERRRAAWLQAVDDWLAGPPARLATEGGADCPGYGFELLALSAEETEVFRGHRSPGTTLNDVLLAGLAVAIERWNREHHRPARRIALTMPVNLRPPEWRTEVLANLASYTTVSVGRGQRDDLETALEAAVKGTRRIKEQRLAGSVVDQLRRLSTLPLAIKRMLPALIPLTGNVVVDTASLSNLGVLGDFPRLGDDAGTIDAVWFSPPNRMPLGASFGVATFDDRLHIALRYRRAQFDSDAAAAFAKLYRDVLST
ncbi:MAG TPA: condensation domain-containing protein [Gaiellaceae bacterium]|jgi:NRPS condensation-like uncharacterized protein|nr:condensation domain-containing protein [Gaiellaceae bacterium]